jgi:hypothetical protein
MRRAVGVVTATAVSFLVCAVSSISGLSGVACRSSQTVDGRSNFVEDGFGRQATDPWAGERIEITNTGVTPSGGLSLDAPGTDRVGAVARMLAVADTTDKPSADAAIMSATDRFMVTTTPGGITGVTSVSCGHGDTVGSADAAESGCDALDVSTPTGAADKLLSVAAVSGNGKVGVSFAGVQLAELDLHASHGSVDVVVDTTKGAAITVVSETGDDITLHLAPDFAADAVTIETLPAQIDTTAFPDFVIGKGRGAAGAGAKTIMLRSGVTGGLQGRIVLLSR